MIDMIKEKDIINFNNLYESFIKCLKGVSWKNTVKYFNIYSVKELIKLLKELESNTYKPSKLNIFKVMYPKERTIISISFRDRVYQRTLNDYVLYPIMTKSFIYDNCALQKNKGTHFALNRLKCFYEKAYRKYGNNIYVLKCDIKKYYDNIRHDDVQLLLKEKIEKYGSWIYDRVINILEYQYKGDKGYFPGSQLVQIIGVSLLNEMDHLIKEKLHIKYYVRYMDDFLLIHNDKEYLKYCKEFISNYLWNKFQLLLNDKKTLIMPIKNTVKFLGYNFRMSDTGKIIIMINKQNVQHEKKKIVRLKNKLYENEITIEKYINNYKSWRAHAEYGNSKKVINYMDRYLLKDIELILEDQYYTIDK